MSRIQEKNNARFKEEKKRLRKKPREIAMKIDAAGHLGTDRVDVVGPCECVIEGDSQELEETNMFNLITFDTQLQGAAGDLPA